MRQKLNLEPQEKYWLGEIAVADLRTPEQVIRWWIREEAKRRGLPKLSAKPAQPETPRQQPQPA